MCAADGVQNSRCLLQRVCWLAVLMLKLISMILRATMVTISVPTKILLRMKDTCACLVCQVSTLTFKFHTDGFLILSDNIGYYCDGGSGHTNQFPKRC